MGRLPTGKSTDEGYGHGHAGGGGEEVLDGEPQHLGEDAHGGLAGVGLPVGIGGKAYGRADGHERVHPRKLEGIERKSPLEPLQGVDAEHAQSVYAEHGQGIGLPVHFPGSVHAADPVEQALERSEDFVQAAGPSLIDPGGIESQGPGQHQ